MSFKCGIVGLPNVGKSTLFNAITNSSKAQAENFPFCTIEPNIGIVPVPDERLSNLSKISKSKKIINTTISFVDIAGLVKGASKGEGLGNKFLSHIREVDAIIHMIRCFESDDIQNVNPDINPIRDLSDDIKFDGYIEVENIFRYCDLISSVYGFVSLHSGGTHLSSALQEYSPDMKSFCILSDDWYNMHKRKGIFLFDNVEYMRY